MSVLVLENMDIHPQTVYTKNMMTKTIRNKSIREFSIPHTDLFALPVNLSPVVYQV